MNFVGTFMFVAVGGTALHYWHGYLPENKFDTIVQERQVTKTHEFLIEPENDERRNFIHEISMFY